MSRRSCSANSASWPSNPRSAWGVIPSGAAYDLSVSVETPKLASVYTDHAVSLSRLTSRTQHGDLLSDRCTVICLHRASVRRSSGHSHPERRLLPLAGVRQESTLAATAGFDRPDGLLGGCAPAVVPTYTPQCTPMGVV